MTFTEFLAALARVLDDATGLPPGPASPPLEPILRVSYDPGCQEATAPEQILCAIRSVDSRLDARLQARLLLDLILKLWRSIAVLTDLAAQRAELAKAQYHYGLHSPMRNCDAFGPSWRPVGASIRASRNCSAG